MAAGAPRGGIPDGHVFTQPWPIAGPSSKRRDQWIYYQYKADRARRTLRGIDEQVAKAAKAVTRLAPVKRNRFIALDGAVKSVNRDLEAKATDRDQGLRHQPRGLPRRDAGRTELRDRELPQALRDREELPHVEVRPAGQARLPPQARLHRGPPDDRVRHLRISRWIEAQTGWWMRKNASRPPAATAPVRSRPDGRPSHRRPSPR